MEILALLSLAILILSMSSDGKTINEIIPILGAFSVAALRLLPSINRILTNWQTFQYSIPVLDLLYDELIQNEEASKDKETTNDKLEFKKHIFLKNMKYKYPNTNENALEDINIIIDNRNYW